MPKPTVNKLSLAVVIICLVLLFLSIIAYSSPTVKMYGFRLVKRFETGSRSWGRSPLRVYYQTEMSNKIEKFLYCSISNGVLTIETKEKIYFQSKPSYYVQNSIMTDMDDDDHPELCMIVWKSGSYGTNRVSMLPYDPSIKCHLFFYEWTGRQFVPFFHSSSLPKPVLLLDYINYFDERPPTLWVREGKYQTVNVNIHRKPVGSAEYIWQHFGLVQTRQSKEVDSTFYGGY